MPKHNWNHPGTTTEPGRAGRCLKCGATRALDPRRERFPVRSDQTEDRGRENSLFEFRLPDGGASLSARPTCAGKGESRRSRKAGRRARVLAASRAGGPRLVSREAKAREAARALASRQPVAIPDPSPTETTS